MKIFTVKDNKADYFLPPFFAQNGGHAQRMFVASLGDSFPFRADFALYEIGHFDDDQGFITARDPKLILDGGAIANDLDPRPTITGIAPGHDPLDTSTKEIAQ